MQMFIHKLAKGVSIFGSDRFDHRIMLCRLCLPKTAVVESSAMDGVTRSGVSKDGINQLAAACGTIERLMKQHVEPKGRHRIQVARRPPMAAGNLSEGR